MVIPWANDEIEPVDPSGLYPHDAAGRVFEETGYVMTGLAGIGRNGDANAQWGRVLGQSGTNIVDFGEDFALIPQPLLGAMPAKGSSAKTPFDRRSSVRAPGAAEPAGGPRGGANAGERPGLRKDRDQ